MIATAIAGFLTSILSGGATGLLGVFVQRWSDLRNKELDLQLKRDQMSHEIALKKADAEIMREEWAARTKVAETEGAARMDVADTQAFVASFQEPVKYSEGTRATAAQAWMFVALDLIRGLVRPLLTTYLVVLVSVMYFNFKSLMSLYGELITPDQAAGLMMKIIDTVLYLSTTCVLWYFGTRNKQPSPKLR